MVKYKGKKIRTDKEISVRKLAKMSSVAPSTISKWENGGAIPDLEPLELVANALGVEPFELIDFIKNE